MDYSKRQNAIDVTKNYALRSNDFSSEPECVHCGSKPLVDLPISICGERFDIILRNNNTICFYTVEWLSKTGKWYIERNYNEGIRLYISEIKEENSMEEKIEAKKDKVVSIWTKVSTVSAAVSCFLTLLIFLWGIFVGMPKVYIISERLQYQSISEPYSEGIDLIINNKIAEAATIFDFIDRTNKFPDRNIRKIVKIIKDSETDSTGVLPRIMQQTYIAKRILEAEVFIPKFSQYQKLRELEFGPTNEGKGL